MLPDTVPAGETFEVKLSWADTWHYANYMTQCGIEKSAGKSSGVQRFLPEVLGTTGGGPWDYTLTVAVPSDGPLVVAASGATAEVVEKDGWRVMKTAHTTNARWPAISIGDYKHTEDVAQKGMPAVSANLLTAYPGQLEQMAPEARRVVSYLQGWLPPFPVDEIDIVEAPGSCGGFVWKAPHGMAELQRMWTRETGGSATPKLAQSVFSHEIAHQYWGQLAQPASLDDRWMVETFAEVYSCMYTAAAFKNEKLCMRRMKQKRRDSEVLKSDPRWGLSLSEAFNGDKKDVAVYKYGPYVMQQMLRTRIGAEAFFGGLDGMLRENPGDAMTSERLKAYLEASSGQDLSDFFSFWVDQGLIPSIKSKVERRKKGVTVTVTSDVPFGTFDLEVLVTEGKRAEYHMLRVVDGAGVLEVEGFKRPTVKVDPRNKTLVRAGR